MTICQQLCHQSILGCRSAGGTQLLEGSRTYVCEALSAEHCCRMLRDFHSYPHEFVHHLGVMDVCIELVLSVRR